MLPGYPRYGQEGPRGVLSCPPRPLPTTTATGTSTPRAGGPVCPLPRTSAQLGVYFFPTCCFPCQHPVKYLVKQGAAGRGGALAEPQQLLLYQGVYRARRARRHHQGSFLGHSTREEEGRELQERCSYLPSPVQPGGAGAGPAPALLLFPFSWDKPAFNPERGERGWLRPRAAGFKATFMTLQVELEEHKTNHQMKRVGTTRLSAMVSPWGKGKRVSVRHLPGLLGGSSTCRLPKEAPVARGQAGVCLLAGRTHFPRCRLGLLERHRGTRLEPFASRA